MPVFVYLNGIREAYRVLSIEPVSYTHLVEAGRLNVILVVGVNGVGKTTTIAKLASRFKAEGRKVMLAAGDTFRAAAAEQLEIWGNRIGVPVLRHDEGADPAAVVYDALQSAKARACLLYTSC